MVELDIAILVFRTFQNFHLHGLLLLVLQSTALRENPKVEQSRGGGGKVTAAAGAGLPGLSQAEQ